MEKTQEIKLLDETIKRFGPDSYLGQWLKDARLEIVRDIESDLPIQVAGPNTAQREATLILTNAQREASEILERATKQADKLVTDARERVRRLELSAATQLERIAERVADRVALISDRLNRPFQLMEKDAAAQDARSRAPRTRIKVVCLDCGKKFACGPNASPECPKCGNTDIDVRES